MKVVLRTPTRLIVHDGAFKTVLIGAIFIAAGGGLITAWRIDPSGWSGNGGPWLIYLVGGLFVLVGLVALAMSADRRYEFDRTTQTARMVVRRLAHRTSSEYPLDTLQDVALERSAGASRSSQGDFYRIVFLTRTGGHLPWTPYGTNDQGTLATCASAVRAFCGWAGTEPPAASRVSASTALSGHPVANNWGCLGAFFALFAAVGLGVFGAEVYRVSTWQPVSAQVLSTDIRPVRGSRGGTSYAPVVQYRYSFGGTDYVGNRVLPIDMSSGRAWAEGFRRRFGVGQTTTAYVNPGKPSSAFLVREVSLLPLLFVAMPLVFGALFYWIVQSQRRQMVALETSAVPIVDRLSSSLK
jgi:hypothetical protein